MLYIENEPDWDLGNLGLTKEYIYVQLCLPYQTYGGRAIDPRVLWHPHTGRRIKLAHSLTSHWEFCGTEEEGARTTFEVMKATNRVYSQGAYEITEAGEQSDLAEDSWVGGRIKNALPFF